MSASPNASPKTGSEAPRGASSPIGVVVAAADPFDAARSHAVCDAAAEVTALHGAELRLLYAVPPVHFPSAGTEGMAQREVLAQASPRLDALTERARRHGIEAAWSARVAKLEDALRVQALEAGADLVVVAPPRRWFPGRWLRRLRERVGAPVLCVPRSASQGLGLAAHGRILVPTLRRVAALRSVAAALRVLSPARTEGDGSRVLLLDPHDTSPDWREPRLASDLRALGVDTDAAPARGEDPVEAVASRARAAGAELVALGGRGGQGSWIRRWLRRSFLGRLVRRLSRPILVP